MGNAKVPGMYREGTGRVPGGYQRIVALPDVLIKFVASLSELKNIFVFRLYSVITVLSTYHSVETNKFINSVKHFLKKSGKIVNHFALFVNHFESP